MTDTERQALGVYLLSPELAQASILTEDHFEAERHRELFVLLKSKAWTDGQELFLHLSEKPRVAEKVGGLPYAMSHMDEAPSTQNVGTYEDALKRKRARSLLAAAAVEAQALSFDGAEPFELVKAVRDRLDAIDIDRRGVVVSATEGAQDVADDLEEEVRGERVPYMTTGWREWDTRWVGIPSEGVLLFLARSGMGKTSLVNSLAVAMAMSGHKVHIHGTETSANKRNRAIIFGIAGISPRQWGHLTLRHSEGRCNGEQLATLRECHRRLLAAADIRAGLPITVTGSGLSCERLCSEVRNQARKGLAVAFVDVTDPDRPGMAAVNGDRMMYAASLPKIAVLLAAFEKIAQGKMSYDDDTRELMERMIQRSDNAATTELMHRVGKKYIARVLLSPRYRLYDPTHGGGLWVGKDYAKAGVWKRDPMHNLSHGATAIQVARFYYLLYTEQLVTPKWSKEMKEVMSGEHLNHKFVRALTQLWPRMLLLRKSGSWRTYHSDSALVERGGRAYIAVALSNDAEGGDWMRQLIVELDRMMNPRKS